MVQIVQGQIVPGNVGNIGQQFAVAVDAQRKATDQIVLGIAQFLLRRAFLHKFVECFLRHLTRLLGFLYVVRYMGEDVGIGALIMVMAVTAVLALAPVTVGALGVMEGSITIMLGAYGVSAPAAVTVALMNRIVLLLAAAVGAVLYASEPKTIAAS